MMQSFAKVRNRLGSFALLGLFSYALAIGSVLPTNEAHAQTGPNQPDAYSLITAELVDEEKVLFAEFYGTLTVEGRAIVERMTLRLDQGQRGSFGMLLTYAGAEPANEFLALFDSLEGEDFAYSMRRFNSRDYRDWIAIFRLLEAEEVGDVRSEFFIDQTQQCYVQVPDSIDSDGFDPHWPAGAELCSEAVAEFREAYSYSTGYVINGVPVIAGGVPGNAAWQAQLSAFGAITQASHTAEARADQRRQFGKVLDDWEINHLCGAVYIGERFLLTAAHCIGGLSDEWFFPGRRVRLGSTRIDGLHNLVEIKSVVTHRNYNGRTFKNDIALIELVSAPNFRRLKAVKLPPRAGYRPPARRQLLLTGWGYEQATRRMSDIFGLENRYQKRAVPELLKGDLKLLPNSACGAVAGELCAGTPTGSGTSCRGDSGGPLVDVSTRTLIGLVSHGYGCGIAGQPATYVDVAHYLDWIKRAKAKARRTPQGQKTTL